MYFDGVFNWHRVFGVSLRQWLYIRHNPERLVDIFFWPVIDLLLWGLTSQYVQSSGVHANFIFSVVTGILFWVIVNRTQHEVSMSVLMEMWDGNLVNMFSTPLTFLEWIVATYCIGLLKTIVGFTFAAIVAFFMYSINIFTYGWFILPISLILILMGWVIGTLNSSVLFYFGTKAQTLVWALIALFSPFSAIFYPLETLPTYGQTIARFIPSSYVFENARSLLATGIVDWNQIVLALILVVGYLLTALFFLHHSFQHLLEKGLLRNN